ncbi:MAG: efflux RND transporter periplasmic adaptor subunit [Pseudomonadales bacterium]|nr:efflux RND transporter periplasmic adaptor subunit [Pseudomonadales bacterium]
MSNNRWALAGIALILALSGCSKDSDDTKAGNKTSKADKPVAVLVAPIVRGTIGDARNFSGSLEATNRFVVASRISATLQKLHVDIGDTVTPGQLIAELDDAEYQQQFNQSNAELAVAHASVAEAKAAANVAKVEFKRAQSLRKQKIASQSEWDQARAESLVKNARVEVTVAQLAQRQAALNAAKVRLGYSHIEARWSGSDESMVVGQRYADEGDLLNTHSSIVSLVALNSLKAVFQVTEKDYPRIAIGQPAKLALEAYPGRLFNAQVARVSPVLDPQSRQATVEVKLENPEGLLSPGMFVRISVELSHASNAQLVPIEALVNTENGSGVYLLSDATARTDTPNAGTPDTGTRDTNTAASQTPQTVQYIEVVTGIRNRRQVQILQPNISGLVVTLGQHLLKDGSAVHIQNPQLATQPINQAPSL